ncbi:MAG: hypothetical protein BWX93_00463 [Bacteroidetes bacterium ADurb.Bin139]|nr:MAG: hypothetical protein BWX93_00463 [Bacteroidetes bacterium ADurb.Bin139]
MCIKIWFFLIFILCVFANKLFVFLRTIKLIKMVRKKVFTKDIHYE